MKIYPIKFVVLTPLFLLSFYASAQGRNGEIGIAGDSGLSGKNGRAGINWVPENANPEFFFAIPILNQNISEFESVLKSGAQVNVPMTSVGVGGNLSAYQFAMQYRWFDGLKLMFENANFDNRPDIRQKIRSRGGAVLNVYEYLILGDKVAEDGQIISSNFFMRPQNLDILTMVAKSETNLKALINETGRVLAVLADDTNEYSAHPNNIEAKKIIESRIAYLQSL